MRITLDMLKEKGACLFYTRQFKRLFGKGGLVTEAKIMRAAEKGLPITWVVDRFFDEPMYTEYWRLRDLANDSYWAAVGNVPVHERGPQKKAREKLRGYAFMCVIYKREAGLI
jgi:hypothetical protein